MNKCSAMSETKYFNFPVKLLEGIFKDKQTVLSDAIYYSLYSHSLKLELSESDYEKFVAAWKWFDVTGVDKEKFKRGKELFNSIPADSPKVGLNISIFWDFYKNHKSDFDIACLAAFLAIKSIIGTKPYCKMNNAYLWARMSGNSKAMKEVSELSDDVKKYANEYQTSKKIIPALREGWGLVYYSRHTRGFYVSFTLKLPELIMEAEKRRKSTKESQYRQYEKEVVKQVLKELNKPLVSPLQAP